MKIRQGFVSNSSSSSFVVAKCYLSEEQIKSLQDYCSKPIGSYRDTWNIYTYGDTVEGFCDMNNGLGEIGGLDWWMTTNGFPMTAIKWEHN